MIKPLSLIWSITLSNKIVDLIFLNFFLASIAGIPTVIGEGSYTKIKSGFSFILNNNFNEAKRAKEI